MITTALTRMFDLRHPLILAPMGNVSGGHLAAAVCNAGGLGLVGWRQHRQEQRQG